jgi:hypothetical protein
VTINSRLIKDAALTTTIRPPFEPRANAITAAFDFAGVAQIDGAQLHTQRRRHGLNNGPLRDPDFGSSAKGRSGPKAVHPGSAGNGSGEPAGCRIVLLRSPGR